MAYTRGVITIKVTVIDFTSKAVKVNDRGIEVWIPFSQIENVMGTMENEQIIEITIPTWLAEAKDLL